MSIAIANLPPGLGFFLDVISPDEESALIRLIEDCALTYSEYDPGNPRCSRAFGWDYDFINDSFVPCAPMPDGFHRIREIAAGFGKVAPEDFAEILLNRYDEGAIIQPHFDKPVWELVIGVSLGADAVMEFRNTADPASDPVELCLERRSLYVLSGDARHVWQHALPPVSEKRWSITFRTMSEEGERLRDACEAAA